jgi:ADP-ribose pyrophosphatase YjhB (NUDIX family)
MEAERCVTEKEFEKPDASVDCVLFTLGDDGLRVLLLPRDREPHRGRRTLVGGYVRTDVDRTLEDTIRRVLRDKAGIEGVYLEQLGTFGSADRDERGWSIAVAYFAMVPDALVAEAESRTGTRFEAVPLDALPDLPFDHARIVAAAAERLRAKVAYSTLPAFLLEPSFTFAEYKTVFEKVLGRTVDQSSLRKKLMDADVLEEVGKRSAPSGPGVRANRPGRLYRLRNPEPVLFDRSL